MRAEAPVETRARGARRSSTVVALAGATLLLGVVFGAPARAATPALSTTASPNAPVGANIFDVASLGLGDNPTGTITFNLYGPDNDTCSGPPLFTSTKPVAGNGSYTSDSYQTVAAGTYRWVASYSGDANNTPVANACNDPNEQTIISRRLPTFSGQASSVAANGAVTYTATIAQGAGFNGPTGTITYNLYGPNNPTCAGTPAFTNTKPVAGNGSYTSDPFVPTQAGTYQWTAVYSGDSSNLPGFTTCTDPAGTVVVLPGLITPTLTTTASPGGPVGTVLTDTATLSGGSPAPTPPTGTITFTLYGPNDATCAGPAVSTSSRPVNGPGNYTSNPFTPTQPGVYRWRAVYSGDTLNGGVQTACGDPAETVTITAVSPGVSITTQASPGGVVGTVLTDTATLSGGANPTGTVTFTLFGPDNPTCSGAPAFTSSKPVAGSTPVTSDPFTTTAPGTYRWVASYSGDANNAAVATACGDPAETVVITATALASPSISTTASANVPLGGQITDTATLTGGNNPTGTITFNLFGPDNATCSGAPVFTSTKPVAGAAPVTSDAFTPTAAGVYRWTAAYGGDANNNPAASPCNAPGESVTVLAAAAMTVAKTANPPSRPEPGGDFTFTVTITNGGGQALTITSVTDDIHGDLATRPGSTCGAVVSTVVQPQGQASCSFSAPFSGNAGASQTDVVTVSATPVGGGAAVTATDEATVTITDVPPSITVAKTASPLSRPAPGGTFTFTVVVTNTGPEPVRITGITDNIYGNAATRPGSTCGPLINATVQPSATATCTFDGDFTGAAGASQTDVVTVTAVDDENGPATASDDATVAITAGPTTPAPQIVVDKAASPTSRPEPGGDFAYTVTVTNVGPVPVRLTGLTDDVHGNLAGRGTCATGAVLAASGGTYSCSFSAPFTGGPGASQTNTVTATAVHEASGQTATASDSAVVTITDVAPLVAVATSADPPTRPEPGGTFTHRVVITNPGTEPVTVVTLVDSIFGDLLTRPGSTCNGASGLVLAPGASFTCTFTADFTGEGNATRTNTVRVTVVDDEGTAATATDSLTLRLTDVAPRVAVDVITSPQTIPEPGGTVTYTVIVRNVSNPETVTIVSLRGDVHGDLNGRGTCRTGVVLPPPPGPGTSYACSFSVPFTGNAGAQLVERVTVTVVDNEGTAATAVSDPAAGTVTITDVQPSASVSKAASTTVVLAPGAPVTFSVGVTNTSFEPVTLIALFDDVHGDLNGRGTCRTGVVIPSLGTFNCTFTVTVAGASGAETDVVIAIVEDDDGSRALASDDATVMIVPLAVSVPPIPVLPPLVGPIEILQKGPVPVVQQQVVPRATVAFTGADVTGPARLAAGLVVVGFLLVAVTWRRQHDPV